MVRLESCSLQRAYTEAGELLGVSHHKLRAWYRDSASVRDDSDASGGETMEEELKRLRRENREPKRANEILKTASAFRSGTRPTHDQMISYIDAYKDQ
ncbi:MAG: IS3 family transposase, partial [Alteromonadaceae bacterium]|nr:IS3 family transposase [Alteromonadaceae bacterium]